ncbi:hypothetical protein GE21DRAFT_1220054 [Neurospora crassa]|nr:hypothetical protein GE21DRAFT_1220054 [Neurospora crassa]
MAMAPCSQKIMPLDQDARTRNGVAPSFGCNRAFGLQVTQKNPSVYVSHGNIRVDEKWKNGRNGNFGCL